MRIINVVVTNNFYGLVELDSFAVIDEQDSSTVVEQAEAKFVERVVEQTLGEGEDYTTEKADDIREDAQNFIEDGCHELKNEDETCVWLRWTDIENVQL